MIRENSGSATRAGYGGLPGSSYGGMPGSSSGGAAALAAKFGAGGPAAGMPPSSSLRQGSPYLAKDFMAKAPDSTSMEEKKYLENYQAFFGLE